MKKTLIIEMDKISVLLKNETLLFVDCNFL